MPEKGDIVQFKIPKWIAEDKKVQEVFSGEITRETEKAYQIDVEGETKTIWIPKSRIKSVEIKGKGKGKTEVTEKERREETRSSTEKPISGLTIERTTRLKLTRELKYINQLMDDDPRKAYRMATQLDNQLQEYLSNVEQIIQELSKKLGEPTIAPAKKTKETSEESTQD